MTLYLDLCQKKKSLTPSVYTEVGKLYQNRLSPCAGWAHRYTQYVMTKELK